MIRIETDPQQINEYVREILSPYLAGNYQLTPEGQAKVIAANAELDSEYAHAHNLPVANWCIRDIRSKLDRMPPPSYETALDVCAGTGYVSLNVMRRHLFKKCVALDINSSALEILAARANDLGIHGIEIRSGDIMRTNFESASFDCVMGNAFLHHLPDNKTFLLEAFRILKPEGVLCLFSEPTISAVKWLDFIPRLVKGLFGKKHGPKGKVPLTDIWQFEQKALSQLLAEVGFKEIEITGIGRLSTSLATTVDRLWVRFTGTSSPSWLGFIFYWLQTFGDWVMPNRALDELAVMSIMARRPSGRLT